MKITPLYDRIIVKRNLKEDTTASGLILSQTNDKPNQGQVISIGNGQVSPEGVVIPLTVKVGDEVLFGRGAGVEIKIDGEELLVMNEKELLAVLEK